MDEEFDIDKEIENVKTAIEQVKATFAELQGRMKLLQAIKDGGYKIVKAQKGEEQKGNDNVSG
jgi:hypothetical protein